MKPPHATPAKQSVLGRRLRERIRAGGPVPWRDFMQVALYDAEHGFYAKGQHPAGVGQGTQFATSPTLHPFFATCIARELADAWKAAGKPPGWEVVEFGAGTGALARDAMAELRRLGVPARWNAIDVRPGPAIKGGQWLAAPPARYDAMVANEFLDALPFDVLEWRDGAWHDVGVGLDGDKFAWHLLEPAKSPPTLPGREDGERQVRIDAMSPWLEGVAAAGPRVGIVVDYGAMTPARDVRAFQGHDFADPLEEPGTVDLTADIDFAELERLAHTVGYAAAIETQESFLIRHGAFDAINRIDRTTREGASSYLRMRQLLLPTGFGSAFKVAVLRPSR